MSQQQIVIVTGGAQGIGLATVQKFMTNRAYVIIIDKNPLQAHVKYNLNQLQVNQYGKYRFVQYDFLQVNSIKQFVSDLNEHVLRGQKVDVLVNNHAMFAFGKIGLPGTGSKTQTDCNLDPLTWQKLFNVNVISYAMMMQEIVPFMNEDGSIINLCSTGSFHADAENICYNASKAAVAHMTRCAAKDLAPQKIRVNGVAPGSIFTEASIHHMGLLNKRISEGIKLFSAESPLNRQGSAHEVADLIYFLSTSQSSFIVGQIVGIDGGSLL